MILYSALKSDFAKDILSNQIEQKIQFAFLNRLGRKTAEAEVNSWKSSLMYMNNILTDEEIPGDAQVAIEYKIPHTSKRVDFILTGKDSNRKNSVIIVELKQWQALELTDMDAMVRTRMGGGNVLTSHPSYQAWSYAALMRDFNTIVQESDMNLVACAYLHNCIEENVIRDPFYKAHIDRAPVFLRDDTEKLTDFIKKYVKYGDSDDILYKIDNGKIRPSKNLADSLASMLKGNQEFLMIDDQKVVYETAKALGRQANAKDKQVLIVSGGPGSGKSVVAINLLVDFTRQLKTAQYVTKNAAPRAVYNELLTGTMKKSHISNMFVGSGTFHETERNTFDVLLIDEAHRLNEKSGLFSNKGENQILEVIRSALLSVFFIDECQKVTFKDIGSVQEIKNWAAKEKATVHELDLASQFRCSGSDAYMAWLDATLQVKVTANETLESEYDFRVLDSPTELQNQIRALNQDRNKARMVAGYCWEWKSKKNPLDYDIHLGDFKMKWNLTSDGSGWIIQPKSVEQIGCIHTCQGLEVDYVGVIIGPDFIVRNGQVITDGTKRAKSDQSIKGFKTRLRTDPQKVTKDVDLIIKNTYRTLMTRGMRGCYIYCTDEETREYFKERQNRTQI